MSLSYRQRQLVTAFVFIAKARGGGVRLSELATALTLANNSASVREIVNVLARCKLVRKARMDAEPRRPWRLFADASAQERAGTQSFETWQQRERKGR